MLIKKKLPFPVTTYVLQGNNVATLWLPHDYTNTCGILTTFVSNYTADQKHCELPCGYSRVTVQLLFGYSVATLWQPRVTHVLYDYTYYVYVKLFC